MAKRLGLLAPIALSLVILVDYQNCAPTNKLGVADSAVGASVTADPNASQTVGIIDDIRANTQVSFVQASASVTTTPTTTTLNGICSQNESGATLRWTLTQDDTQATVATGFAACDMGGFQIAAPADAMTCGTSYHLLAQFGVDPGAQVQLEMPCAN